jgi:hypothetical protein
VNQTTSCLYQNTIRGCSNHSIHQRNKLTGTLTDAGALAESTFPLRMCYYMELTLIVSFFEFHPNRPADVTRCDTVTGRTQLQPTSHRSLLTVLMVTSCKQKPREIYTEFRWYKTWSLTPEGGGGERDCVCVCVCVCVYVSIYLSIYLSTRVHPKVSGLSR